MADSKEEKTQQVDKTQEYEKTLVLGEAQAVPTPPAAAKPEPPKPAEPVAPAPAPKPAATEKKADAIERLLDTMSAQAGQIRELDAKISEVALKVDKKSSQSGGSNDLEAKIKEMASKLDAKADKDTMITQLTHIREKAAGQIEWLNYTLGDLDRAVKELKTQVDNGSTSLTTGGSKNGGGGASEERIVKLEQDLAKARKDINNSLSLIGQQIEAFLNSGQVAFSAIGEMESQVQEIRKKLGYTGPSAKA